MALFIGHIASVGWTGAGEQPQLGDVRRAALTSDVALVARNQPRQVSRRKSPAVPLTGVERPMLRRSSGSSARKAKRRGCTGAIADPSSLLLATPYRTFGPDVVTSFVGYTWFYYVGQMTGSLVATLICTLSLFPQPPPLLLTLCSRRRRPQEPRLPRSRRRDRRRPLGRGGRRPSRAARLGSLALPGDSHEARCAPC